MKCARCQSENTVDARFREECGAKLEATCPRCGLTPGKKFCRSCGAALTGDTASRFPTPESYTAHHLAEKILVSRASVQGERKPVTVLFCDLVSSTALAERLGPDRMHALLRIFFERALGEVHRYEGTVNQFLGDGLMALFGAPIAHEDHARRALLAAVAIRRALAERPVQLGSGEEVALELRMGAHTGFVVVGAIGDNLRMDYTAVGDTTHLAARLQQLAEPGAILISDATAHLVDGYMRLESRGPTTIRGKSELGVHAVLGTGTRRSRLDGSGRALSRFVGRDRELSTLLVLGDAKAQAARIDAAPGRWRSALALRRVLRRCGRHDQAAREAVEARAALERVAAELRDPELRRLFEGSDAWREANPDESS